VLLVPLVGTIDAARAAQILERVLEEVGRAQAERVLLDITGVPLVDSQVAAALVQMTRAVGLLGAKVTLVGVRPEIAQSIVGLGADLGMIETRPVLAAALPTLIKR
jgi:anti-anti-sigma factor